MNTVQRTEFGSSKLSVLVDINELGSPEPSADASPTKQAKSSHTAAPASARATGRAVAVVQRAEGQAVTP